MEKTVWRHREGTAGRQGIRVMHPRAKRHLRPPTDGGEAWNNPSQDLLRERGPVTPWVSSLQRCGTEHFCCSGPPRMWSFARQSQETIHILSPPLLHTQSPSSSSERVLSQFLPPLRLGRAHNLPGSVPGYQLSSVSHVQMCQKELPRGMAPPSALRHKQEETALYLPHP